MQATKSILNTGSLFTFGTTEIQTSQIFLLRKNVVGLVNLRPLSSGHVLVCSRRRVKRLKDLNEIETIDLWLSAQEIQRVMQDIYKVNLSIATLNLFVEYIFYSRTRWSGIR